MKFLQSILCLSLMLSQLVSANTPVPIIFDTDMGNDIDDALAQALIYSLEDRGECKLLAVTISKDNAFAPVFVSAFHKSYRSEDVAIGAVKGSGVTPHHGRFLKAVVEMKDEAGKVAFPSHLQLQDPVPDAVSVMRKQLSLAEDGTVVLAVVGSATNAAALLESGSDEFSDLSGKELVKQKVKLLAIMAGSFEKLTFKPNPKWNGIEYNVKMDVPAAQKVFHEWPTPVRVTPFLIGYQSKIPYRDVARLPKGHILKTAYDLYIKPPYDRPLWDVIAVLDAIRPDRDYFAYSTPGEVRVDEEGRTIFEEKEEGRVRVVKHGAHRSAAALEAMSLLSTEF